MMTFDDKEATQAKERQEKVRVKINEQGMRFTLEQLVKICKSTKKLVSKDKEKSRAYKFIKRNKTF